MWSGPNINVNKFTHLLWKVAEFAPNYVLEIGTKMNTNLSFLNYHDMNKRSNCVKSLWLIEIYITFFLQWNIYNLNTSL
jgi:hypothetical protein